MDGRNPLFGAVLRAERAKVPIRSIKRHLQRWAEAHWEYIEFVLDEQGNARMDVDGHVMFTQKRELPVEILGKTSVWIGETIYNLRGALDYLVYALAAAGKGGDVKGTQFPMEDDLDVFRGRVTGKHPVTGQRVTPFLRYVHPIAVARIMQLQPGYKPPCKWTAILRDLSNPDKHRFLTELSSRADVVAGYHPYLAGIPDTDRGHPHVVVDVLFRKSGLDVVDTLETLQREVRAFVKEFEPAFQRPT